MSERVTVTEVRNALRCPRIFALGRTMASAVLFPVGSSCLGATFHRIVDRFAASADAPGAALGALPAGAPLDDVEAAVREYLLDFLVDELGADPTFSEIPGEVDDLAEALRQFARYLAGRIVKFPRAPGEALSKLLASGERAVEAQWPSGPLIVGRLDALFADPAGALEVVEYKLTDEANDLVDRAQVVLYREILRLAGEEVRAATVLRFSPSLREAAMTDSASDALLRETLAPTLAKLPLWAKHPETAPPTSRRDLCAACPVAGECALRYPERLGLRDDPPTSGTRPLPTGERASLTVRVAGTIGPKEEDRDGLAEALALRAKILEQLSKLGASAASPEAPVIGPRTIEIEVTRSRGTVTALDRAAVDIQHRIATELGVEVSYEKEGGHRKFVATRAVPRAVYLQPLLTKKEDYLRGAPGRFLVGEQPNGQVLTGDFSDGSASHLLVAGQTGSGKSVFIQSLIASLVAFHGPGAIRFHLVDPKRVTFTGAEFRASIASHLAEPIRYDVEETMPVVGQLIELMEERYRLFEDAQVSDIGEFNEGRRGDLLERRILVVDEFQDLLGSKEAAREFDAGIRRLGAKARAAGVHLVLATQRPSREVVSPLIKANLCGRIAFQVSSEANSKIVLDERGAERLFGKGDLLANLGRGPVRAQAPLLGPRGS